MKRYIKFLICITLLICFVAEPKEVGNTLQSKKQEQLVSKSIKNLTTLVYRKPNRFGQQEHTSEPQIKYIQANDPSYAASLSATVVIAKI